MMANNLTVPAPGRSAVRPESRTRGVSENRGGYPLGTRRRAPQPRRKPRPRPTIFTPGIPQWPSRDPIGEKGGVNLYGFVGNDGLNWIDEAGLRKIPNTHDSRKNDDAARRLQNELPPNIDKHQGPLSIFVRKANIPNAREYFGVIGAREALRLTLQPLIGKGPGSELNTARNLQQEHTGSICTKCITCPNGETRYHVLFTAPSAGAHGVASRNIMRDKSENFPALCPEGYVAIGGYHSHPQRVGGTTEPPTPLKSVPNDYNDEIGPKMQWLVDLSNYDNLKSVRQIPSDGEPEYIGGIVGEGKVHVWRRPELSRPAVPEMPKNEPCP